MLPAQRLAHIRNFWPGADDFLMLHEVGHIELNTEAEREADCWAAEFLRDAPEGEKIVMAAESFFRRARLPHIGYADGPERADYVVGCYLGEGDQAD